MSNVRVTVWNEFRQEPTDDDVGSVYPDGIHRAIADGLAKIGGFELMCATLDEPEHGLTEDVLASTDVLIWWGHKAHGDVRDDIVERVKRHVLEGMGLIVLHSAHFSKIFRALMGTNCSLKWRQIGERERLWNLEPAHPITEGIGEYIELDHEEMYGERFDIPNPDETIFISWFAGGEVFRSGCCWRRGYGRVFYFQPGHETYPIFYNEQIMRVLANACRWGARRVTRPDSCPKVSPIENIGEFC